MISHSKGWGAKWRPSEIIITAFVLDKKIISQCIQNTHEICCYIRGVSVCVMPALLWVQDDLYAINFFLILSRTTLVLNELRSIILNHRLENNLIVHFVILDHQ